MQIDEAALEEIVTLLDQNELARAVQLNEDERALVEGSAAAHSFPLTAD